LIQLSSPLNMNDPDLAKICLPPKTGKILWVIERVWNIFLWINVQFYLKFLVVVDDSVSTSEYPPVNSTVTIQLKWMNIYLDFLSGCCNWLGKKSGTYYSIFERTSTSSIKNNCVWELLLSTSTTRFREIKTILCWCWDGWQR
jgi:hypothetical protein